MSRLIFDSKNISEDALKQISAMQSSIVKEVSSAVESNDVLVVGMKGNPHCIQAVKTLKSKNISHQYLEYGSYLKGWRKRLSLKIWIGWKTFPMVFIKGTFIGGKTELLKYLDSPEGKELG